MNRNDELIIEHYFSYINMSKEERNKAIGILLNLKDISDSEYNIDNRKYNLVTIIFKKKNDVIYFNGAITNGSENKYINGSIKFLNNKKYYIKTKVERLGVQTDKKEYTTEDTIIINENNVLRKSTYDHIKYFEDNIRLISEEEVKNIILKM